ncbi:MAG: hypothetical protein WBX11_13780 [Thiobacillaceae bacterium]
MTINLKGGRPNPGASIRGTDASYGETTSRHSEPVHHSATGDPAATSVVPSWVWWVLTVKVLAVAAIVLVVLMYG